jgi:penicillin-binding protein 1C
MVRPFIAPQFCTDMRERQSSAHEIHTTLDLGVQRLCERLASGHAGRLRGLNIHNLSIVVLDNTTSELLALVGSPDFNDSRHDGQVNGATAHRSPGSTLKPFAYALAFDKGLVVPATKVEDIPVSYSGYSPENYDEEYHGLVSVRQALIQSLNVPAVNVTSKLGLRQFYDLLKEGGLTSLDKPHYLYGLPLVLGASEVSLLDLSNLYATFARGGVWTSIKQTRGQSLDSEKRLFSEETSFIVSTILSNLERPELASSWEFSSDRPTIAWKTGTSYGRKDAWTIGYNPDFTVGVWVGNFSAEASPYLVGVEVAAPIMLDVFQEITRGKELTWFDPPPDIEMRDFCAASGMQPGPDCPQTAIGMYIRDVSPGKRCDIHKAVRVDAKSGYMVCRGCGQTDQIVEQVVEEWPPKVSGWLLARGMTTPLPEHNPDCRGTLSENAPVITSPEDDGRYVLTTAVPREYQKIMLEASVAGEIREVHWFLNREWFATVEPGMQLFYVPEKGTHRLMCVDDLGRSMSVSFVVE